MKKNLAGEREKDVQVFGCSGIQAFRHSGIGCVGIRLRTSSSSSEAKDLASARPPKY
jgi:hypothetical protein